MPRWDFECKSCGCEFEFFKIRSDETVKCPACDEERPENLEQKVAKETGFALKGKGWYKDGY